MPCFKMIVRTLVVILVIVLVGAGIYVVVEKNGSNLLGAGETIPDIKNGMEFSNAAVPAQHNRDDFEGKSTPLR